jgi:hypothetical protein
MAHDVISTCPVCSHELSVTRLHCGECGTSIEGDFSVGRFGRLNAEQLALLESFLRSRGNLREMERELGISYPTVRGRVENLVRALGFAPASATDAAADSAAANTTTPDDGSVAEQRRVTLERLARREISPEDAALALRALGSVPSA